MLLADDHALVREGLKLSLQPLGADLRFVEAATAAEVTAALARHPDLDLVLLDLVMPGATGFDLLAQVCDTCPELPVVMLSATSDPPTMRKALDIGAAGFITKAATPQSMLSALQRVLAGGICFPPDMLGGDSGPAGGAEPEPGGAGTMPPVSLTARQTEVLAGICQGWSNKQIARELDMSGNTVKTHVAAIFRTLNVDNRTQAAVAAREQGLFSNGGSTDDASPQA